MTYEEAPTSGNTGTYQRQHITAPSLPRFGTIADPSISRMAQSMRIKWHLRQKIAFMRKLFIPTR